MKEHIFWKTLLPLILYIVVFFGSATGVLAGVPSDVFENVLSYNNHVYAITVDSMTWADAETLATTHGGHLVTVNDSAENQFLSVNYASGNPWIGLNNISGSWAWAYGWTDYTNWSDGEPSGGTEHCVLTNWLVPGEWNDGTCTDTKQAIVEWKSVPGTVTMPQTGQTACYNAAGTEIACAGTGQDGDINSGVPWPKPRFAVSGNCVTDNLTGLMWAKDGNLPIASWQGALDYVAALNSGEGLCSYFDWRLPNANELRSLTYPFPGTNTFYTWLNAQGFTGVAQAAYWSSTTGLYNTGYALYVSMADTLAAHNSKTTSLHVLPVRGVATGPAKVYMTGQTTSYDTNNPQRDDGALQAGVIWPALRFTDTAECAIDNLTGLIWTKEGNTGQQTWQAALDYAASLNELGLCGRTDWRLPNLYEIKSLMNHGQADTTTWLNAQGFLDVQDNYYWSSSNYQANAWTLSMGTGTSIASAKSGTAYVWPVSGRICYDNLAKRSDTGATYPSIQGAYDAALSDHILKARASTYCEDINFDGVADIVLAGGYDQGFASQTGDTIIYGSVTIGGGGSVRAEYIIIL